MLKALRELRIKKKLAESSLDNVKPTDDQGSPPAAKSHKLGPDEKLDDSSEIYDAHFSGFSRNDASSVTHSAMTSDLTFNNNTTIAEERYVKLQFSDRATFYSFWPGSESRSKSLVISRPPIWREKLFAR